jgi:hypothetical protein
LRPLGKSGPARIAAGVRAPGKNFRTPANSAGWLGKYFHFSEKFPTKNPAIPREKLVHGDTAGGEQVLSDPLRFRSVGLAANLTSRLATASPRSLKPPWLARLTALSRAALRRFAPLQRASHARMGCARRKKTKGGA